MPAARLHHFTQAIFERAGLRAENAELMADHLVWADLRGSTWLGVKKIPQYLARLRAGSTFADAELEVLRERPGFFVADGNDGFGQVVCPPAMNLVIDKARANGVGSAVVKNTTSAGMLGYFAMMAAKERMVGLAINNSPPLVCAPGGAESVVGNQAFAIASPAGRHSPLLLDMATSAITLVGIHKYEARGEKLPPGLALNVEGEPTVHPAEALAGILQPMGGHRGFALALLWEVLTGVLAGGPYFSTDVTFPADNHRPQGVSVFLLAIDPTVSVPYETFVERVDRVIDNVHASKMSPGADRPVVPGERSNATKDARQAEGIPVATGLLKELREHGRELGVSL